MPTATAIQFTSWDLLPEPAVAVGSSVCSVGVDTFVSGGGVKFCVCAAGFGPVWGVVV